VKKIFVAALALAPLFAQESPLPRVVNKDGRYALFVDGAPFLMLGAQVHNSSAWPAMLPKVWSAMKELSVNTVEIPIYWEQFEPGPGQYDFTVMDTLLREARQHQLRLVLLWFGTWKNGSQHYMPQWMKLQPEKYPRIADRKGRAVDSPSPYAAATLEADKKAFSALMRHLKETDPRRTVIMVQVENEAGTWGAVRDYSPAAEKLFEAPVPREVLDAMGVKAAGNWTQAFGAEAEACFHAWSVARYVGQVAAEGKKIYPLPLYANAALRDPLKPGAPGSYESGGPTDNVLAIWKAEAPALDVLSPDIYLDNPAAYLKVLELYRRGDNPLFVPETGGAPNARFLFSALGLGAIGFAPFGMDGNEPAANEPWAMNNRLLLPMQREIARLNFEGKLKAVAEEKGKLTQTLPFAQWNAVVSYGVTLNHAPLGNPQPVGRALVAQTKDNEFLVTGYFSRVDFNTPGKQRQFLAVEEGSFEQGVFKFRRIWNGDETDWGLNFGAEPAVLRVTLGTY